MVGGEGALAPIGSRDGNRRRVRKRRRMRDKHGLVQRPRSRNCALRMLKQSAQNGPGMQGCHACASRGVMRALACVRAVWG